VTRPLTAYAREALTDRARFESRLSSPLLLWEQGERKAESVTESLNTATGEWHVVPRPGDPLVLQLKITDGDEVSPSGLSIGRSETNDLVVENPSVSRLHALFHRDERTSLWTLTDVGSRNGTWLGEVRLLREQSGDLADGEVIRLGDVRLRFLLPTAFLAYLDAQMRGERSP
jgi:FHA domain